MNRTPFSSAIQAMRRSSLIPPTLVTSGCTMSNARCLQPGLKGLPAGQDLAAGDRYGRVLRSMDVIVQGVGVSGSSNQWTP